MTSVEKQPSQQAEPAEIGITLSALTDRLGPHAAQELLSRIDHSQRRGTTITGTNVRGARTGFSKAQTEGCVQVVLRGAGSKKLRTRVYTDDSLVIIKMVDFAAVVRAGQGDYDWVQAFQPRSGLEAATISPILQRGSTGRRELKT